VNWRNESKTSATRREQETFDQERVCLTVVGLNFGLSSPSSSLLISLAIFRSLVTECRRDIALLSSSLIGSIDCTLASVPSDLEVVARAASVVSLCWSSLHLVLIHVQFTAWTTYTNGQLIGADSSLTNNYLSILSQFANLSSTRLSDQETQNRFVYC